MEEESTLLFVEDESNDELLLTMGFRNAGVRNPIQVVNNAFEAMDYMSRSGGFADWEEWRLPGLVVSAYEMPGMDGIELCCWIHENRFQVPVVILVGSGPGWEGPINRAYEAGAIWAAFKTSDTEPLAEDIMAAWDKWKERQGCQPVHLTGEGTGESVAY